MSLWDVFTSVLKGMPGKSIGKSWAIETTGYNQVRDVLTLIDAVCDVYDRNDFKPNPDGSTYCNQAVNAIAQTMGCKDFDGKNANEIVLFISTNPDWSPVLFENAQDLANQGSLLVAGLSGPDLNDPHGHVVVIRPGRVCQSGKWGPTPRCVNIGKADFIARAQSGPLIMMPVGLNDAFIPKPIIYVWRPSL